MIINTEIVIIFISSIIILGILADDIRLRIARKRLINSIVQITLDNSTLQKKLADATNSPAEVDGFIKFLSDSRESAYEYIENVQEALKNYLNAINENDQEKATAYRLELFAYLPDQTSNN